MADTTKTVEVVFSATDNTAGGINSVTQKIQDLEKQASSASSDSGGIASVGNKLKQLDDAGKNAAGTSGGVAKVGEALKSAARNASDADKNLSAVGLAAQVAADNLNLTAAEAVAFDTAVSKLIGPQGSIAALVAVIAALGIAGLSVGADIFDFETKVKNLGGSASSAKDEFEFVKNAAQRLGSSITLSKDYSDFLIGISNTKAPAEDVQAAFLGFSRLFEAVGGSASNAKGPAKDFLEAISDDNISSKELEKLLDKTPGLLNAVADALGVPTAKVKELADNGQLGAEAINKIQNYLVNGFSYESLTPVIDAFRDLWDQIKILADDIGLDGAYTVAIFVFSKAIQTITLAISGSQASFVAFGETLANFAFSLQNLDWSGFIQRQDDITNKFSVSVSAARSKLLGLGDGITKFKGESQLAVGLREGAKAADELTPSVKEVSSALRNLGLNPKQFQDDTGTILASFNTLLRDPSLSGDQVLQGLAATLVKLSDDPDAKGSVEYLGATLQDAFDKGKLGANELQNGLKLVDLKLSGVIRKTDDLRYAQDKTANTASEVAKQEKLLAKQAADAQKAIDQADLKIKEIASNERIKVYEATIKLNIANVEANAKIAQSIIESIAKTYEADIKLISEVLDQVQDGFSSADKARLRIVDDANARVNALNKAQLDLIAAQSTYMQAKTAALLQGTPLITVNGAGLQPHLEAFMWEILKAIQVRVAKDGLDMLLGLNI